MIYLVMTASNTEIKRFTEVEDARAYLAYCVEKGNTLEQDAQYKRANDLLSREDFREAEAYAKDLTGAFLHYLPNGDRNDNTDREIQTRLYSRGVPQSDQTDPEGAVPQGLRRG